MANISEEKWIEILEKKADGTYIVKYPKVKSKSGITFDEHLAESATGAHKAKNIAIEDAGGHFTATDVEGALEELFTSVSNGKSLVGRAITDVDDSVVIPADPTFNDLANAIGQIRTGKKWASGSILALGEGINGVRVEGLDFRPSIFYIYYNSSNFAYAIDDSRYPGVSRGVGRILSEYFLPITTFYDDGFFCETTYQNAGRNFEWFAWE